MQIHTRITWIFCCLSGIIMVPETCVSCIDHISLIMGVFASKVFVVWYFYRYRYRSMKFDHLRKLLWAPPKYHSWCASFSIEYCAKEATGDWPKRRTTTTQRIRVGEGESTERIFGRIRLLPRSHSPGAHPQAQNVVAQISTRKHAGFQPKRAATRVMCVRSQGFAWRADFVGMSDFANIDESHVTPRLFFYLSQRIMTKMRN